MGGIFSKPKSPPTPPPTPPMPTAYESEQAGETEMKRLRRRRGFESTIVAGSLLPALKRKQALA